MRALIVIVLIIAAVAAQLPPGSMNTALLNGKGGLGRYIRHLEGDRSYYPNGNAFGNYGYAPSYRQQFGYYG